MTLMPLSLFSSPLAAIQLPFSTRSRSRSNSCGASELRRVTPARWASSGGGLRRGCALRARRGKGWARRGGARAQCRGVCPVRSVVRDCNCKLRKMKKEGNLILGVEFDHLEGEACGASLPKANNGGGRTLRQGPSYVRSLHRCNEYILSYIGYSPLSLL
jgi:hypothetical protein